MSSTIRRTSNNMSVGGGCVRYRRSKSCPSWLRAATLCSRHIGLNPRLKTGRHFAQMPRQPRHVPECLTFPAGLCICHCLLDVRRYRISVAEDILDRSPPGPVPEPWRPVSLEVGVTAGPQCLHLLVPSSGLLPESLPHLLWDVLPGGDRTKPLFVVSLVSQDSDSRFGTHAKRPWLG